jgi:hypothetical protein
VTGSKSSQRNAVSPGGNVLSVLPPLAVEIVTNRRIAK